MSFVHMEHRGCDAEGAEEPDAADAQHDLLADAVVLVAAVDVRGQISGTARSFWGRFVSRR